MRLTPILVGCLAVLCPAVALAGFAIFQINGAGALPTGPGLTIGTYGSTTASGWTHIGPSNGTLASAAFTNIIYVSDSLGSDNRDGSTPTFVDDNTTAQFVLSSTSTASAGAIYSDGTRSFTVAVAITAAKFVQMTSRTGIPGASGTLTRTGGSAGDATMTFTASTPGIHGPVKTLTKGAGGSGPGVYDPENSGTGNGDGTGLGTIGNWHTAGAGNGFALRNGKPDWLLLRMGDTFTNQTIETAYNAGASDNFNKGGFSEQEPMVISSYDEAVPATSPDLPSGARARPIVLVPGANPTYATSNGPHAFQARPGVQIQGPTNYIAVMGIDFYSAQRDPGNGAYIGSTNVLNQAAAVVIPGGQTGILIEDVRGRWMGSTFLINDNATTFDVNIRRTQADHCYNSNGGNIGIGYAMDGIGTVGGAISPGFTFEENVIDQCGYADPAFTTGDSRIRNVYIQYTAVFGNRRGNTSTRSGAESMQFRSGGVIDNNFNWGGIIGSDVGHPEGDPALTSSTVVTNNVFMNPLTPFASTDIGINFLNSNNGTATGNIIANANSALAAPPQYAATDQYQGDTNNLTISNPGSGGVDGYYGCIGGVGTLTGGHGSGTTSTYSIHVVGGILTGWELVEATTGGMGNYLVGDVLTPIANFPSINTAGTTLTNAGTGGTAGTYGQNFAAPFCPLNPIAAGNGIVDGIALTNFSGSMAGSGARAWFVVAGGSVTSYGIIATGNSYQVGDVLTASFGSISGVRITVNSVAHLSGWTVTVASLKSSGVHGLSFTNNIVFNWAGENPPVLADAGGTNDSPGGVLGSGAANIWTPNSFCVGAQFTGAISAGTTLTTSSVVNGPIASSTNLAGPGVAASTTIVSGGPTTWVISPSQSNISAETMYSYTCTPTKVYAHPERTVETYAASLGLTASIDGYMNAASANAKWNWNPALTANNGINPYIRLGFQ